MLWKSETQIPNLMLSSTKIHSSQKISVKTSNAHHHPLPILDEHVLILNLSRNSFTRILSQAKENSGWQTNLKGLLKILWNCLSGNSFLFSEWCSCKTRIYGQVRASFNSRRAGDRGRVEPHAIQRLWRGFLDRFGLGTKFGIQFCYRYSETILSGVDCDLFQSKFFS